MIDFTKPVRLKNGALLPKESYLMPIIDAYFENVPETDAVGFDKPFENIDYKVVVKSRPYQQTLIDSLKDPKEAMAYLEAALENIYKIDGHLLLADAVKNVIDANKEPAQYVWINLYDYSGKENLLCFSRWYETKEEAVLNGKNALGRIKVKLERRFDE